MDTVEFIKVEAHKPYYNVMVNFNDLGALFNHANTGWRYSLPECSDMWVDEFDANMLRQIADKLDELNR